MAQIPLATGLGLGSLDEAIDPTEDAFQCRLMALAAASIIGCRRLWVANHHFLRSRSPSSRDCCRTPGRSARAVLKVAAGKAVGGVALPGGEVGRVLDPGVAAARESGRLFTSARRILATASLTIFTAWNLLMVISACPNAPQFP